MLLYFLGTIAWLLLGWLIAACKDMITGFNFESFLAILVWPIFVVGDLLEAMVD